MLLVEKDFKTVNKRMKNGTDIFGKVDLSLPGLLQRTKSLEIFARKYPNTLYLNFLFLRKWHYGSVCLLSFFFFF